ncbi:DUF2231 domain-containing protein [Lysobacter sp. CFH 32150]|uniref:DUF2231 domain-containing protein n=1 Tax=Lysobacter sp. CFH 32150 TaxID=2927128 RepID=UPI001FA79F60|nr:DUF2231 domain-containing protein [Lysobacter sp. CFH 32150]MCI4568862.1 DUF2231 domain-containing protein [Lysobacter sp. CFH 32150]
MKHPLHPALVHFPIACWSLATMADLASLLWGKTAWMLAGVLLAVGVVTAIAAMATGFIELLKVDAEHPATRDLNRHMILVMTAWSFYAASLFLRLQGTTLTRPDAVDIGLSLAGFVCLGIAGWFGGKLVYAHGIGVAKHPPA